MLRIWNVQKSQLVKKWIAHGNAIQSVAFTMDGKGLVSSSRDGTWKNWNISLLELAEPEYRLKTKDSNAEQKINVTALCTYSASFKCSCSTILSHSSLYPIFILPFCLLQNDVKCIAISPDGQWIVSGSDDHTVCIWDLCNATPECTLRGHKARVWSIDFCPTGNYFASGSRDHCVVLWRYEVA